MPESLVGEGLVIDEQLPVAWAPGTTDEAGLARLNVDNHQLLMADATLDEVRIHDVLKDESPALVHELQRLDYKLNLLLRLTAELAMRQNGLPQKRRVRLSATGLVWPGEDAPEKGSTGLLMLYMNPALPQPLKIAATASDASQNGVPATLLQFTGLSESVVELIEKMIFRHHRRLVAGARLAPNRPS